MNTRDRDPDYPMPSDQTPDRPLISVLMANYNAAPYLGDAIRSVLAQTWTELELILVDDGSSDSSVAIAEEIAQTDGRLKILSGERLGGPAPVRNKALDHARGDWVAVVDSDDLIHPERFAKMMAAIETTGTDILIDDLVIFHGDGSEGITTMFEGKYCRSPQELDEADYVLANRLYAKGTTLGYAKPLIRRSVIEQNQIRYNNAITIGEDYDLIVRLLAAGSRMTTLPEPLYFYRKHDQSISHRLNTSALEALREAAQSDVTRASAVPELLTAHASRLKSIERAIYFEHLLGALKEKEAVMALSILLQEPSVLPLLWLPLRRRISDALGLTKTRQNPPIQAQLKRLTQAAA